MPTSGGATFMFSGGNLFTARNATKDASMSALQSTLGLPASRALSTDTAFAMLRGTSGFTAVASGYDEFEDLAYVRLHWKSNIERNIYLAAHPDNPLNQ
jgi:hypothetical protein